jgi:hypothetical protein
MTSLFEVSAVVMAADKVFGITYKDGRVYSGGCEEKVLAEMKIVRNTGLILGKYLKEGQAILALMPRVQDFDNGLSS